MGIHYTVSNEEFDKTIITGNPYFDIACILYEDKKEVEYGSLVRESCNIDFGSNVQRIVEMQNKLDLQAEQPNLLTNRK